MTDDALLEAVAIDLAYDPHELRNAHGEWTKSPNLVSGVDFEKVYGDLIAGQPVGRAKGATHYKDSTAGFDEYALGGFDATDPEEVKSVNMAAAARLKATAWHNDVNVDPAGHTDDEEYAAALWHEYQNPEEYGKINYTLRTGHHEPGEPTAAKLRTWAQIAFAEGGSTIPQPMTVFRALRSTPKKDWAKELKPGTVFTDKGIISTTAYPRFAQGWLGQENSGSKNSDLLKNPDNVVLEVRLPAGQRILGGDLQFIETMLPPGTQFKIVSNEQREAQHAASPLGGDALGPFHYTHVVAEVVTK